MLQKNGLKKSGVGQVMENKKSYAVDSIISINQAVLKIDNKVFDLTLSFPKGFRGKVVINVEQVLNIDESFSSIKEDLSLVLKEEVCSCFGFNLETSDNQINHHYNESFSTKVCNEKNIIVLSSIDVPYIATGPIPESKIDYVESSKILNLYIIITDGDNISFGCSSLQVFDAYGNLGFVIINIDEFDEFVSPRVSSNDLIEEFTTTEIANEIFDKGLMMLSWGHTPWVYYINSSTLKDVELLMGEYTGYYGFYNFKNSNKKYSVIPGNELRNWDNCKKKDWPLIVINGNGDYVLMKLYIKNALSQSDRNYPIPTFHLKRFDKKVHDIEPLLQSNILNN